MLPGGLTAHLAPAAERARLGALLHGTLTVAELVVGGCSCNLVRARLADPGEDERHLRERYRRLGAPRDVVIRALERHRRGGAVRAPAAGWPRALAAFVAEHARNAGDTLYDLRFAADPHQASGPETVAARPVVAAAVVTSPDAWLAEGRPVLVAR